MASEDDWLRGKNDRATDYFRIETIFRNDTKVAELLEKLAADAEGESMGEEIIIGPPPAWRRANGNGGH